MWSCWYRQVLFSRSCCERNRGLHMFSFQSGETVEDVLHRVSGSQACQHRAEGDAGSPEDWFSAAQDISTFPIQLARRRAVVGGVATEYWTAFAKCRVVFQPLGFDSLALLGSLDSST